MRAVKFITTFIFGFLIALGTLHTAMAQLSVLQSPQGGTGTNTRPTADQILIGGDTPGKYDVKTLTPGTNISIATTSGRVTISSTGSSSSSNSPSKWATSTVDATAIQPAGALRVWIGTTTANSFTFVVQGSSFFSGDLTLANLTSTGTVRAGGSLFASSTISVDGNAFFGGNSTTTGTNEIGALRLNSSHFTSLTGSGLQNVAGVLTLDRTGDWTGTFDGQEGTFYLARANHTGTQAASTITAGTFGSGGDFIFPSGTLNALGSTTLQNFTFAFATGTAATTSSLAVSGTATTSSLFGAHLSTCDATNGKITWASGFFACGTDQSGNNVATHWATTTFDSNAIQPAGALRINVGATTTAYVATLAVQGNELITGSLALANLTATGTATIAGLSTLNGGLLLSSAASSSLAGISSLYFTNATATGGLSITSNLSGNTLSMSGLSTLNGGLLLSSAASSSLAGISSLYFTNGTSTGGFNVASALSSGSLTVTNLSTLNGGLLLSSAASSSLAGISSLMFTNATSSGGLNVIGHLSVGSSSPSTNFQVQGDSIISGTSTTAFLIASGTAQISGLSTLSGGILSNAGSSTLMGVSDFLGTRATTTSFANTGTASTSGLIVGGLSLFGQLSTLQGGVLINNASSTIIGVQDFSTARATTSNIAIGTASTTSGFFQQGLSTCSDTTNSKVLWNSTTGKFTCGTDQQGTGAFPFTTTRNFNQVANATTTQIWLQGTPTSLSASSTIQANDITAVGLSTLQGGILSNSSTSTILGVSSLGFTSATGTNLSLSGGLIVNTASSTIMGVSDFIATNSTTSQSRVTKAELVKTGTNRTSAFEIQDASASQVLSVSTLDSFDNIFEVATTSGATFFLVDRFGRAGIGTTTPSMDLSVQGDGLFSGNVVLANLTATGTAMNFGLSGANTTFTFNGNASNTIPSMANIVWSISTGTTNAIPFIGINGAGGIGYGCNPSTTSNFTMCGAAGSIILDLTRGNTPTLQIGGELTSTTSLSTILRPVVSSCGTTPTNVGNDINGRVTAGSGTVTTCLVTFAKSLTNRNCFVNDESESVLGAFTVWAVTTNTTLTITAPTANNFATHVINYWCAAY